jgi:hypothetical protein
LLKEFGADEDVIEIPKTNFLNMLKELNVIHDEESHETKYFLKQYDEEE